MGMSMSTILYPLSGRDENETKVLYPLSLNMGMEIHLFYRNAYGIAKLVHASLPSLITNDRVRSIKKRR